jgi:primase-polymerase (primpol)-like protein
MTMWDFFRSLVKAREEWMKQRRQFPSSARVVSD